jgi:hypothetical protein
VSKLVKTDLDLFELILVARESYYPWRHGLQSICHFDDNPRAG